MAAPFVGFEQDFVGNHVELLLHLALHVVAAGAAQHAGQAALADGDGDGLAGARDDFDQQAQVVGNDVLVALFLDQEAGRKGARIIAPASAIRRQGCAGGALLICCFEKAREEWLVFHATPVSRRLRTVFPVAHRRHEP
jgi:hypothetical protein